MAKLKCGAEITLKFSHRNDGDYVFMGTISDHGQQFRVADTEQGLALGGANTSGEWGRFFVTRRAMPDLIKLLQKTYRGRRKK